MKIVWMATSDVPKVLFFFFKQRKGFKKLLIVCFHVFWESIKVSNFIAPDMSMNGDDRKCLIASQMLHFFETEASV